MLRCAKCNVTISTQTDRCPLCHQTLPDIAERGVKSYPDYRAPKTHRVRWLVRTVSLAAVGVIGVSAVVNMLTWSGRLWCVVLCACVLYAWLLGLVTVKPKIHLGLKLLGHALGISLLALVIDAFAFGTETFHRISWAVSYAMPIVLAAFVAAITVMMLIKRWQARDYVLCHLALCAAVFVPLILVLCGVADPVLPSAAAAACSSLTAAGTMVFARQAVFSQIARTFHI